MSSYLPSPAPTTPSTCSDDEFDPLAFDQDLTPLPEYKPAGDTALDFGGLLPAPLKVYEDLTSGCGGQTWPAGMVLARHMLRYHRDNLHDARILEIGAGGGLVGLAVAKGCVVNQPMYITDQLEMLKLMQHNIALNDVEGRVKPLILNWGEPLPAEVVQFQPTVILAADCVYFEPAFPLLLKTLHNLLALGPPLTTTIFFCFKKRRRADMQFLKNAKRAFVMTEVADDERPVFSRQGLSLYTITSKPSSKPNDTGSSGGQADGATS